MSKDRRRYEAPRLSRIRLKPEEQMIIYCKTDQPFGIGCWENPYLQSFMHGS